MMGFRVRCAAADGPSGIRPRSLPIAVDLAPMANGHHADNQLVVAEISAKMG